MPTINQLIKKPRRSLPRINKVKDLEASPQKRGVCLQVLHLVDARQGAAGLLDQLVNRRHSNSFRDNAPRRQTRRNTPLPPAEKRGSIGEA